MYALSLPLREGVKEDYNLTILPLSSSSGQQAPVKCPTPASAASRARHTPVPLCALLRRQFCSSAVLEAWLLLTPAVVK